MTPHEQSYRLLRIGPTLEAIGDSRSGIYRKIKDGTMTPPVRVGEACSAWPEHELAAINRARIAGKSTDEIRSLVRELVTARKSAA